MMSILWQHNNFDLSHHLTAIKDNEPNLFWMRLKNSFVQILLGPIYFIGTFLPYILMSRLYNSELLSSKCCADTKLLQLWSLKSGSAVAEIYDILVNLWHSICRTQTRSFLSILMQKHASFQNFRLEKRKSKFKLLPNLMFLVH